MTRGLDRSSCHGALVGLASFGLVAALSAAVWAQDATPRTDAADHWAVVNADGTLARGLGVKSVAKAGVGDYRVAFDRKSLAACGFIVTLGRATAGHAAASGHSKTQLMAAQPNGFRNRLQIITYAAGGGPPVATAANRPFHLYVVCR